METLQLKGVETIPFAYPFDRDRDLLEREIVRLAEVLGTTMEAAGDMRRKLGNVRDNLDRLDEMSWRDNVIRGAENHLWLVCSSDFNGDPERFGKELAVFLAEAAEREPLNESVRLACIGVPPILDDLHDTFEEYGARSVLNEVQRQFSMPERNGSLVDQYLDYTYPYSIFHRLDFIQREIDRRRIDGVVHYVQSFCHRHIEDMIIREKLNVPVLTIEGENPGTVDERTRIRIQAFVEMVERSKVKSAVSGS